jgi:hypothetical protein
LLIGQPERYGTGPGGQLEDQVITRAGCLADRSLHWKAKVMGSNFNCALNTFSKIQIRRDAKLLV